MFDRPHHRRIAQVLRALDGDLLRQARCYFGGGTAIVLLLDEYRESLDIDFCRAGCACDGARPYNRPLHRSPATGRPHDSPACTGSTTVIAGGIRVWSAPQRRSRWIA